MNQAISASGAQMKEALDLAPMAVLVSSAGDNRLLYANRLAKDVFLKDLEEGENGFSPQAQNPWQGSTGIR